MKKLILTISCILLLLLPASAIAPDMGMIHGSHIRLKNGTSLNWSGYAVETNLSSPQNYAVSDVKGVWTVPPVTDTINSYSSTWIGIDGYSDNTVEQIGTDSDWYNGAPRYYAWYEMYPKWSVNIKSLNINPGDTISAEVKYIGNNKFSLSITDVTTGQTYTTTQKGKAKRQSAEWIVEAPSSTGGVLPLANFGSDVFTSCYATVAGATGSVNDVRWQNDAITMVSSGGALKAQPSELSPDGTSFGVTWYSH